MLLVRHASAGDRDAWTEDDRLRPLDDRGRRQAENLVDLLADYEVERVLSSPYTRCVQTVAPLARARGLEIQLRDELGEELQDTLGAALVRDLAGKPVAACCHGGLSEVVAGEKQKKGETLVLDEPAMIAARIRAD